MALTEKEIDMIPIESDDEVKVPLGSTVMNQYLSVGELLIISKLDYTDEFQGVAYCTKMSVRPNVYEPQKYDTYFKCIDGCGVGFQAVFYGGDFKPEEHKGPIFLEGIKYYSSNVKGVEVARYRLTRFNQVKADYPKGLFLKYIDNHEAVYEKFLGVVNSTLTTAEYKALYIETHKYGLLDKYKEDTLTDTYGTKAGCKMEFVMSALKMIEALPDEKVNKQLIFLAFLLKTWHPEDEINGIDIPANLAENYLVEKLIFNSALTKTDQMKLLGIMTGQIRSIESEIFKKVYDTMDTYCRLSEPSNYMTESTGLLL